MTKNAMTPWIFVLLALFGQACITPPSSRQPTSRLTKESPVNETANDPRSETAISPERAADSSGIASIPGRPSGGSAAWEGLSFDRYAGFGQGAWGHRKGTWGTSLIIVVIVVTICVVGLVVALSKIRF